jgi:hypothetical protein
VTNPPLANASRAVYGEVYAILDPAPNDRPLTWSMHGSVPISKTSATLEVATR